MFQQFWWISKDMSTSYTHGEVIVDILLNHVGTFLKDTFHSIEQ